MCWCQSHPRVDWNKFFESNSNGIKTSPFMRLEPPSHIDFSTNIKITREGEKHGPLKFFALSALFCFTSENSRL